MALDARNKSEHDIRGVVRAAPLTQTVTLGPDPRVQGQGTSRPPWIAGSSTGTTVEALALSPPPRSSSLETLAAQAPQDEDFESVWAGIRSFADQNPSLILRRAAQQPVSKDGASLRRCSAPDFPATSPLPDRASAGIVLVQIAFLPLRWGLDQAGGPVRMREPRKSVSRKRFQASNGGINRET
jgi:hypothetical protein